MRLIDETEYQERLAKIPMKERTFRKAVEVAEEAPTIDAVPVVRCKDCKHGSLFSVKKRFVDCPYYDNQIVDFDHYCSYGERKEGADGDNS